MVDSFRSGDGELSRNWSWQRPFTTGSRIAGFLEDESTHLEECTVRKSFEKELHQLPIERRQLIFRIRRQLAEGTYDAEEKLPLALGKLLQEISPEPDRED